MKRGGASTPNKVTKECIFTALMILAEQKRFHEITVTEIAEKAGVSRMAYYRNYSSKEEIIVDYLDEVFKDYLAEMKSCGKSDAHQFALTFFAYFRKQERLIRMLIVSDLTNLILERFDLYLRSLFNDALKDDPAMEVSDYAIHYLAGGLYKVLIEWVRGGVAESDDEMANIVRAMLK